MGETEIQTQSNKDLFLSITKNPWDESVFRVIVDRAKREKPWDKDKFFGMITLEGYLEMVNAMKSAKTLEEKYRLLAGEPPIDPKYKDWYRAYRRIVWYDFIQGFPYSVSPPKVDQDPLSNYPDSVYELMGRVLSRSGRNWKVGVDLGSGPGEVSRLMAKTVPKVIAIDRFGFLHEIAMEREKERGITNIVHIVGDLTEAIPLESESVDVITSNGLTAFIPKEKLPLYVQEIARVLRIGGSYFEPEIIGKGMTAKAIVDGYSHSSKGLLAYMIGELVTSPGKGLSGVYPHNEREIDEVFQMAGFRFKAYISVKDGYVTGIEVIERILRQ